MRPSLSFKAMRLFLILAINLLGVFLLTACTGPTPLPSPQGESGPTLTPSPSPTPTAMARPSNTPTLEDSAADSPPASSPTDPTPTPNTAQLLIWVPENLPLAQQSLLDEASQAFMRQNAAYQLELRRYATPQDLSTAILEGRVDFDLVLGSPALLAPLQARGNLQAMNALFPPSFLDDFINTTLTSATRDEQLWGLPDSAGFHLLLYYNRNSVDSPPTTLGELLDLAESLTSETQTGLVFNSRDPLWLVPWLSGYGGWLHSERGSATLNSEAMVTVLENYQGWHRGTRNQEAIIPLITYAEARTRFNTGRAAMLIDGEWAISELNNSAEVPWGVALLPTVAGQTASPLVVARYWGVSKGLNGQQNEAVVAFLSFITAPEQQLSRLESLQLWPTRRSALSDPLVTTSAVNRIGSQQLVNGRGMPLGIEPNGLLDAMREPLNGLLNGDLSPAEAAEAMQSQFE